MFLPEGHPYLYTRECAKRHGKRKIKEIIGKNNF
jgi:hypothetical protein